MAGVEDVLLHGPVEDLLVTAREHRSELRQLELMEALRGAELRLERWSYLPSVSLFGSYTIGAQDQEFNFFGGSSGVRGYGRFAGVRVTMPIFAGFQRPSRIAQREATVEQVRVYHDHDHPFGGQSFLPLTVTISFSGSSYCRLTRVVSR